jgi:hypothetical protein
MLQSKYLPEFHFSEKHSILISTSPEKLDTLLSDFDSSGSWIIRTLLALRGISSETSKGIEGWKKMGFVVLEHQPNKEIILGLVGQFWSVRGNIQKIRPEEFIQFSDSNYAKATWNFEIIPQNNNQLRLVTETRIQCTDEKTRKKLGFKCSSLLSEKPKRLECDRNCDYFFATSKFYRDCLAFFKLAQRFHIVLNVFYHKVSHLNNNITGLYTCFLRRLPF